MKGKGMLKRILEDNRGIGVVEMILILVVLVGLVMIFKTQLSGIVTDVFSSITKKVGML